MVNCLAETWPQCRAPLDQVDGADPDYHPEHADGADDPTRRVHIERPDDDKTVKQRDERKPDVRDIVALPVGSPGAEKPPRLLAPQPGIKCEQGKTAEGNPADRRELRPVNAYHEGEQYHHQPEREKVGAKYGSFFEPWPQYQAPERKSDQAAERVTIDKNRVQEQVIHRSPFG